MLPQFSFVKLFEPLNLMGILAGIGIGLIIGGIVGYVSKGSALREEQKRKELKQLRKEKAVSYTHLDVYKRQVQL